MTPVLARCSQGHVFDRSEHGACPHCGEQSAAAPPANIDQPDDKKAPSPDGLSDLAYSRIKSHGAFIALALVLALASWSWSTISAMCCSARGSADHHGQSSQPVAQKPDLKPLATDTAGEETLEGLSLDPKSKPELAKPVPVPEQKHAGLQIESGFPKSVPDPNQNDGPNYAVYATETSNALSPLARELLATSRGYFAFVRKDYPEARAWLTTKAARSNPAAISDASARRWIWMPTNTCACFASAIR